MPHFREAGMSHHSIVVDLDPETTLAKQVHRAQNRGFENPCRQVAIFAIHETADKLSPLGFVVIGLNPRTPFDDASQQFIRILSRLVSTSLQSILLHKEDIARRERLIVQAELMKSQLAEQLSITQKEVERTALRFQRFAERADIGVFILGRDGVYKYRNPAWYDMLQPENPDIQLEAAWEALIDDEYIALGRHRFDLLMREKSHQ